MGTAFEPTDWQAGVTPYSTSEMNKLGQGIAGAAPVGTLTPFAGPDVNVPSGWLPCDGSQVSRTTYDVLYAAIGDTWGAGDGSTTFNLPDLQGLFPLGAGAGETVGDSGGSETHSHTNPDTSAAGSHAHTQPSTGAAGSHAHSNPSTSSAGGHLHTFAAVTDEKGAHAHSSAGSHAHSTGSSGSTVAVDSATALANVSLSGHTHSVSSSGSHSHGTDGGHRHGVPDSDSVAGHAHTQGSTGTDGNHSHSNPNTASVANHQHTQGATNTADHRPPWAAVTWLIRY